MLLKKAPAYRKAEKEDFSMIREFIRRNYKDRWEFEETHTEQQDADLCRTHHSPADR